MPTINVNITMPWTIKHFLCPAHNGVANIVVSKCKVQNLRATTKSFRAQKQHASWVFIITIPWIMTQCCLFAAVSHHNLQKPHSLATLLGQCHNSRGSSRVEAACPRPPPPKCSSNRGCWTRSGPRGTCQAPAQAHRFNSHRRFRKIDYSNWAHPGPL